MFVDIKFDAYETKSCLLDLLEEGLRRVSSDLTFLADTPVPEEGIAHRRITVGELMVRAGCFNYVVEDFVDISDVLYGKPPKTTNCYTFGVIDKIKNGEELE